MIAVHINDPAANVYSKQIIKILKRVFQKGMSCLAENYFDIFVMPWIIKKFEQWETFRRKKGFPKAPFLSNARQSINLGIFNTKNKKIYC